LKLRADRLKNISSSRNACNRLWRPNGRSKSKRAGDEGRHCSVEAGKRADDEQSSLLRRAELADAQVKLGGFDPGALKHDFGELMGPVYRATVTIPRAEKQDAGSIGQYGRRRDKCQGGEWVGGQIHSRVSVSFYLSFAAL
jgi:hypothetical protein